MLPLVPTLHSRECGGEEPFILRSLWAPGRLLRGTNMAEPTRTILDLFPVKTVTYDRRLLKIAGVKSPVRSRQYERRLMFNIWGWEERASARWTRSTALCSYPPRDLQLFPGTQGLSFRQLERFALPNHSICGFLTSLSLTQRVWSLNYGHTVLLCAINLFQPKANFSPGK